MTIIIASSNKGKIKELKTLLPLCDIKTYKEVVGDIEIIEDKETFKGNAIKKAQTIYDALSLKYPNNIENYIVIADDSGISVEALNFEPNIFSARYAGENATDKQNNEKLIQNLKNLNIQTSKAFYTACISLIYKNNIYTTHGWMYGKVIDKEIGNSGFGYDPLFIPTGYSQTLGELSDDIKKTISHRFKAMNLALKIIKVITL
jgi:XTP/dITP diphosphohydrolase